MSLFNVIIKNKEALFILNNNDFYNHLKNVLKQDNLNKYIDDEDNLNKDVIINDLNNYNTKLLSSLMKDKIIIHCYAKSINGQLIFNFESLKASLQYKNFWEDSYTKFSNKIGLSSNGKFIDNNSNVVLDFPFKDTILKGGMKKEDRPKTDVNESFLNDVIARPEIDEMFEPKVLMNSKKYDENGKHNNFNFSDEDNLIIKGNNLIALHSLKQRYAGKIKLIYIDPPYNTGNDSFEYNDRYNHSTWLTFMKNRLKIAKDLLSSDGSIWISIDSHESHYLKVLADEVLGIQNFVDEITWQRAYAPVNLKKTVSRSTDSILIYANHFDNNFTLNKLPRSAEANNRYKNPDNDSRGPWGSDNLSVGPAVQSNIYEITTPSGRKVLPPSGYSWRLNQSRFKEYINDNRIWFGKNGNNVPRIKRFLSEINNGVVSQTLWTYKEVGHNQDAKREIKRLFGKSIFNTPKPEKLLQRIITMATDKDDIVLDFFMGSATTQAVAMKMHRRFIGIEQMDYINTVSVPRLQKVIAGEQGGISKDVNWQGGESFVYAELMNKNNQYIKEINNAKNIDELNNIYENIKENIDFNINIKLSIFEHGKYKYSFEDQKKLLIQMLDKNQLYYNYHNIDDNNVKNLLSRRDYKFNKQFYS